MVVEVTYFWISQNSHISEQLDSKTKTLKDHIYNKNSLCDSPTNSRTGMGNDSLPTAPRLLWYQHLCGRNWKETDGHLGTKEPPYSQKMHWEVSRNKLQKQLKVGGVLPNPTAGACKGLQLRSEELEPSRHYELSKWPAKPPSQDRALEGIVWMESKLLTMRAVVKKENGESK